MLGGHHTIVELDRQHSRLASVNTQDKLETPT